MSLVTECLRDTPIRDLPKVVGLLVANATDLGAYLTTDPTGRQALGFLEMLAQHWTAEHSELVAEVKGLQGGGGERRRS